MNDPKQLNTLQDKAAGPEAAASEESDTPRSAEDFWRMMDEAKSN